MIIVCPSCEARYNLAQAIAPPGRKVRCRKCTHIWWAAADPAEPELADQGTMPPPPPELTGAAERNPQSHGLMDRLTGAQSEASGDAAGYAPSPYAQDDVPRAPEQPTAFDAVPTALWPIPAAALPFANAPEPALHQAPHFAPSFKQPSMGTVAVGEAHEPAPGSAPGNWTTPWPEVSASSDAAANGAATLADHTATPHAPLPMPPATAGGPVAQAGAPPLTPWPDPWANTPSGRRQPGGAQLASAMPSSHETYAPAPGMAPARPIESRRHVDLPQSAGPPPGAHAGFSPGLSHGPGAGQHQGAPPFANGFPPPQPAQQRQGGHPGNQTVGQPGAYPFPFTGHAPPPAPHDPAGVAPVPLPSTADESQAAPDVAAAPPARRRRSWASIAASVLLILSAIGLIAYLAVERNTVARHVPGAAGLYAAVGMPVNPHGLALRNIKVDWVEEDSHAELEVRGEVHNLLGSERRVPSVVIVVRDRAGASLYHTTGAVGTGTVSRGGFTRFTARIPAPPPGTASVAVHFPAQR